MTYTHNPYDPMVLLVATAQDLLDQYNSSSITLQQYKDAVNAQVTPFVANLDTSSHNDAAMYKISTAVAMVGAPD